MGLTSDREIERKSARNNEVVASIESLVTTWTAKHRQSALDGDRNIWMLKPGALSSLRTPVNNFE